MWDEPRNHSGKVDPESVVHKIDLFFPTHTTEIARSWHGVKVDFGKETKDDNPKHEEDAVPNR